MLTLLSDSYSAESFSDASLALLGAGISWVPIPGFLSVAGEPTMCRGIMGVLSGTF